MNETILNALRAIHCTAETPAAAATRITIARHTSRRYSMTEISAKRALGTYLRAGDIEKATRAAELLLRLTNGDHPLATVGA